MLTNIIHIGRQTNVGETSPGQPVAEVAYSSEYKQRTLNVGFGDGFGAPVFDFNGYTSFRTLRYTYY